MGEGGAADQHVTGVDPPLDPVTLELRDREISLPTIPDELLVDIFLRLPTQADLVRAAAGCISFLHIISDRSFIRRFRKIHPPPLLGFLDYFQFFHPAVLPHPSAPAAKAVAAAADFSFSFLPTPACNWDVQDICDGCVVLTSVIEDGTDEKGRVFRDMVVCDPLYRQYLLLPPIPDDLVATVEDPLWIEGAISESFFLPLGSNNDVEARDAEEMSFKVIWMAQGYTMLVSFLFSSSTGQWCVFQSINWSSLVVDMLPPKWIYYFIGRQYMCGCFYWVTIMWDKTLVLDTQRMEFDIVDLLPKARPPFDSVRIFFVEAGESRTMMFVPGEGKADIEFYISKTNKGESSSQWQLKKTISVGFPYWIVSATQRHVFLYVDGVLSLDFCCFSLDLKTFQLERICVSMIGIPRPLAYSNFPPLWFPTVASGNQEGDEKEILEQGARKMQAEEATDGHHDESMAADANAEGLAGVLRIGDGAD